MANKELLITLGLDSSSYTQNVKRAKDLTKELDSSFKLISSSTENFEKSIEGLTKKKEYLVQRIKIANGQTEVYSQRIKESKEEIKKLTSVTDELSRELAQQKEQFSKLKSTDAGYKEKKKEIEGLVQQIDKCEKAMSIHNKRILEAKKGFNETQIAIQQMNREISATDEKLDSLGFEENVKAMKKDISDLDHSFEVVRLSTENFDNSLEGLGKTKTYLNEKISKSSNLLKTYESEIEKSSSVVKNLEAEQKAVNAELRNYEKILSTLDETDDNFEETNNKVKELRTTYSSISKTLELHKKKVNDLGVEYKSTEKELLVLNNSLKNTSRSIVEMQTKIKFDKADEEINKVSTTLKTLKNNFEITKNSIKDFDSSMEGLYLTETELKKETILTNQILTLQGKEVKKAEDNIQLYSRRIETVQKEIQEWRSELSKIEKDSPDYDKMASKIKTLENILDSYNVKLDLNSKRLQDMKADYSSSEKEVSKLTKSLELNSSKIEKMNESVNFVKFESELNKLANVTINNLEKNISSLEDEFDILGRTVKGYEKTFTGLNEKKQIQTKIVGTLKTSYKEYSKEVENSRQKVASLTKQQSELEEKIKSHQKLLSTLKGKEWDQQKLALDKLNEEYVTVNKNLNKHKDYLKTVEGNYTSTGKKVASLNSELEETKRRLSSIGKENNFNQLDKEMTSLNTSLGLLNGKFELYKSSIKNYGTRLSDLAKTKEHLGNKIDLLKSKLTLYSTSLNTTERNLNKLKLEQKDVSSSLDVLRTKLAQTEQNSPEYKKTIEAIIKLEKEYQDLEKEIDDNTRKFNELQKEMYETGVATNNLTKQQNSLNKEFAIDKLDKVKNFSNGMKNVGQSLIGVSLASAGVGAAMVKTGLDFTNSMSEVKAITRASDEDFKKLTETARRLGQETVFTGQEVAEGLKYLSLAGYSVEDSMSSVEYILRLAQAASMDLGEASDLATDSLASLGYVGEEAVAMLPTYLDKVAFTANYANTEIDQMMEAIVKAGGQFDNLSMPLDVTNSMLGILGNRGIKASEAGVSLNSVLINMTKATGESAEAMEQLKVSAFDSKGQLRNMEDVILDIGRALQDLDDKDRVQLVNMLGGKTQAKTVQKLLQGMVDETGNLSEEYTSLKANIEKAPDMKALEAMSNTMTDNLGGDLKLLLSSISEMFLVVFDEIEPQLRSFIQGLTEWIKGLTEKFKNLSPDMQMFVVVAGAITAVIPPLLIMFGALGSGLASVGKFFVKLVDKTNIFSKGAGLLSGTTSKLSSTFKIFGVTVSGTTAILTAIVAAIGAVIYSIGENENALAWLQDKWGVFGEVVGAMCESFAGRVQLTLGNIIHLIKGIVRSIGALLSGNWRDIDDIWRETWADMENTTAKALSNIAGESTKALSIIRESSGEDLSYVKEAFEKTLETLPTVTKDNLEEVSKTMTGYFEKMDKESLTILRGTSDTMAIMLEGITEGMDSEKLTKKLEANIEGLLNAGKISASELEKDFSKANDLIAKNMADSFTRAKGEAEKVIKELERVAVKGVDGVSEGVANLIKAMDENTFNSLKSVGGEWETVFKGLEDTTDLSTQQVSEIILKNLDALGLKTPEGVNTLVENLKTKLNEVGTSVEENVDKTTEAVNQQVISGSVAANEIVTNMKNTTTQNANELYTNIVTSVEKMGVDTATKLSTCSSEWCEILNGAFDESGKLSDSFVDTVKGNFDNLNLKTPEQIAEFAKKLEEGLQKANIGATEVATQTKNNVLDQTQGMVDGSVDVGKQVTENVTPENLQEKVAEAMRQAEEGLNSQKASFSEEAKAIAEEAEQKFRSELENMATIEIPDTILNVEKIQGDMGLAGQLAVQAFATSWSENSHIITDGMIGTFNAVSTSVTAPFAGIELAMKSLGDKIAIVGDTAIKAKDNLNKIQAIGLDKPKEGANNLKNSLNEARKGAINLKNELNNVSNVKVSGIVSGLETIKNKLTNITNKAKSTKSSLNDLSKVSFSSNHKALDTTSSKLDKVKKSADNVKKAMEGFLKLSFSSLSSNLDKIASKLSNIKSKADTAKSSLSNINSVGFSYVISSLSSLNSWINTVKKNASSARANIANMNSAKPASLFSLEPQMNMTETIQGAAQRFKEVDITPYQTTGGYYQPQPIAASGVTIQSDNSNDALIKTLLQQNQLLMQILGKDTDINVNLDIDGRTLAKSTARYMNSEIDNFNKRKTRLGGRFY